MKRRVHVVAATLALGMILVFWVSTLVAELALPISATFWVKQSIARALLVFVPCMAITATSGFALAGRASHPLLNAKRQRMPYIAANGLLILAPAALFLAHRAQAGSFDGLFYAVQAVELIAGAINISLMTMNFRDGLRLRRPGRTLSAQTE